MRRKLFTVASVLSLLLFLATVVLWVLSYRARHVFATAWPLGQPRALGEVTIESSVGHIVLSSDEFSFADQDAFDQVAARLHRSHFYFARLPPPSNVYTGRFGFSFFAHTFPARGPGIPTHNLVSVVMPDWLQTGLFAILPACFCVRKWRKWRQPVAGLCAHCHYDLTGNTSGVCPECGKPTSKASI